MGRPLLHFIVGGAVLYGLVHGGAPMAPASGDTTVAPTIVVTATDVARLRSEYTRETGLEASDDDEAALVSRLVEEELLFREALARGLDRGDPSVRNWLVGQMEVLADDPEADPETLHARARELGLGDSDLVVRRILVQKMRLLAGRSAERDPSDEELRELQARHVGEYLPPAHVSFWHVFVAWSRGKDVEVDVGEAATTREAEVLLSTLRSKDVAPTDATHLGDSFFLSSPRVSQPLPQVERLFGVEFADDLLDAATGRWIGPLRSPYGLHLVRIESREPGEPPTFEALRGQLAERWRDEQRREGISRLTRELARRHPLEIESAAWRSRHEG